MERLFGWLSGARSEEEEREESSHARSRQSRERELRPLTDAAVTTYGSHGNCEVYDGRGGEDYVIIVSDSDSPADACSSCEEVRKAEGHPATPPMSRGILKTSHRHPQSSPPCPHHKRLSVEWRTKADLPVRMKGLQTTLHNGKVIVGGGYTGHAHSEMTVYEYDPNFDLWAELPVSPMRWFGIAEYKGQLVLVGGKDLEVGRGMKMTNRIAIFDEAESRWLHPYPPMSAARAHPVVFSHAHLLVVAGGRKGVLDFNVEVFDGCQWTSAPSLPVACSPLSSLIHCGHWYLLGGQSVSSIHQIPLQTYLSSFLQPDHNEEGVASSEAAQSPEASPPTSWERQTPPPFLVSRIMSLGHHLAVFAPSDKTSGVSVQVHLSQGEDWVPGGCVPHVCGSASSAQLPRGDLLLMGGDVDGIHYSNKVYRVSLGSTGPKQKRAKFTSVT